MITQTNHTSVLGMIISCGTVRRWRACVAFLITLLLLPGARVRADVRVSVRESSWSVGREPTELETLVTTYVKGRMRRVENEIAGAPNDSLVRAGRYVQIDRLDRDSSYFFRPAEQAYVTLPLADVRTSNTRQADALRGARAAGTAPRDTLAPVRVLELGTARTILGESCRGYVVELVFTFTDSTASAGSVLTGLLSDTLWMAGANSAAADLRRFEREFSHATLADSFLAAANAVQLSMVRGQGLVAVIQRAIRAVPGYPLESHFVNLLHGMPEGMQGVERLPDGAVVVQRTRRQAIGLSPMPIAADMFEVPAGYRRVERGGRTQKVGQAP